LTKRKAEVPTASQESLQKLFSQNQHCCVCYWRGTCTLHGSPLFFYRSISTDIYVKTW